MMKEDEMNIKEDELISRTLKTCENCEWCVPTLNSEFPHCLLKKEQTRII